MRTFYLTCAFILALLYATALWWCLRGVQSWSNTGECIEIYQKNARTPIFTGFLTMGSFLLALKTTILGRIKETYDTDDYRTTYAASRNTNPGSKERYYGSLERLSGAIGLNVIFCLITSFSQMTFGFVSAPWAFALCVSLAAGSLLLLFRLTVLLMAAHREWFVGIEAEAQKKLQKVREDSELPVAKPELKGKKVSRRYSDLKRFRDSVSKPPIVSTGHFHATVAPQTLPTAPLQGRREGSLSAYAGLAKRHPL